jgi:hypothetical protein
MALIKLIDEVVPNKNLRDIILDYFYDWDRNRKRALKELTIVTQDISDVLDRRSIQPSLCFDLGYDPLRCTIMAYPGTIKTEKETFDINYWRIVENGARNSLRRRNYNLLVYFHELA